MTKVAIRTLDSVTNNDTTATQLINENFQALQTAIENTLSRDGTTPNFMDANLDLNSYKIINAGTPTDNTDVITKEYFDQNVGDAAGYAAAAASSAQQASTFAGSANSYATVATGAANIAQAARDYIESDPGFVAVSTDLQLGVNGSMYKVNANKANIDTVASNITDVNTVAGINTDVSKVAAIDDDVTAVANIDSDVTTVASIKNAVVNVSNIESAVLNVSDDRANIDMVAQNINNVNTVSSNITNVNKVGNDITNVNAVAGDLTNIDAVVDNETNINAVAGDLTNIDTVANNETSINTVANKITEVDTVAWISGDVTTVAGNSANINTVAGDIANVNAVASDIANVNAVAADLTNIDAASGYAAEAKQWAIGDPSEPTGNSAKYWAEQASSSLSGLTTRVSTIEGKIPSDASSSNQLAAKDWVENKGYITGITSGDVTTALGYTPYNSSNPDGYQTASDVATAISGKQDTLISGTNIKTINSTSLLGSGDVAVQPTLVSGTNIKTVNSTSLLGSGDVSVQETLVSGTNIKTINSNSILGSGDITIDGLPSQSGQSGKFLTTNGTSSSWANVDALPSQTGQSGKYLTTDGSSASWATVTATVAKDNLSITENSSNQLQTVGVINQRDTSTAIKTWTGTKTQYNAITTKDANTLYNITDDSNVTVTLLEALYPVGSIYITTAASCPLTTLISGSTWTLQSSAIVTSVNTNVPVKGNGKTLGLTNGTDVLGPQNWGVGLECRPDCYDKNVGTTTGNVGVTVNACVGMTTDASKSGVVGTVTRSTLSVNIFKRTA